MIDHRHYTNPGLHFPCARVIVESVGAAATLIAERCRLDGSVPSRASTILLYGAIFSNTLSLRGSVTTHRDVEAANWLQSRHAIPADWLDEQFAARKQELMRDMPAALVRERKQYEHQSGPYAVSQLEYAGAEATVAADLSRVESTIATLSPRTMANLVDVRSAVSFVVCPDPGLQALAALALDVEFQHGVAEFRPGLLRKQIVAALST